MKICGIYAIVNIYNDKLYIGSSSDIKSRWQYHKSCLQTNSHYNNYLQRAYNAYSNPFIYALIETCEKNDLIIREQYWIDATFAFGKGYNLRPKAENNLGKINSNETKQRMSKAQKGKIISKETRQKLSKFNIGKKLSEETKYKIGIGAIGRKVSEENKKLTGARFRKSNKWPCPNGCRCKCEKCMNINRERDKIRYKRKISIWDNIQWI